MPLPRKLIGIAVVEHAGGYLVGVRGNDGPLPGFAEFPGGKCHDGETPQDCAARECEEETGLRVEIVDLLYQCDYDYPHAQVALHFFLCRPITDVSALQGQSEWISAAKLHNLNFPPANDPVIELLISRALRALPDQC